MWDMLERTADSTIPRNQGNNNNDQVTIISVPGLPQKSYQEWVVRQPISSHVDQFKVQRHDDSGISECIRYIICGEL